VQKKTGEKRAAAVTADGVEQEGKAIPLIDDGQEHVVEVVV
jgi:hypothetical protein